MSRRSLPAISGAASIDQSLMRVATFVPSTGVRPGRRIDSQFETLAMNVICQGLHVGKFLVSRDVAVGVALFALPSVVDVDVGIPGILHAVGGHGIGDGAHG